MPKLSPPKSKKQLWRDFDHRMLAHFKNSGIAALIEGKRVCVAFSGGADSVALANTMVRLQKSLKIQMHLAHFHHGPGKNIDFRNRSLRFCEKNASKLKLPFFSQSHKGPPLKSEAQMRDARWSFLNSLLRDKKIDFLFTAHHADDQLETRMLNLLRGCGPEGLQAMGAIDKKILRPFLLTTKEELLRYLKDIQVKTLKDPSNEDSKFRRNWLRNEWLSQLEKIHPGSRKALARSLETIAEAFKHQSSMESTLVWYQGDRTKGIDRRYFCCLSRAQQKQMLVSYLRSIGAHDFRHTQVEEIVKNLDRKQIRHTFTLIRLRWQVNAEQILAHS